MKTLFSLFSALFVVFASQAQEICLVSADYLDGENYIVAWSKPIDPSIYDSVFIYRMQGQESAFTKVGSQSMADLSLFKDLTSNTLDSTKYKISFLDNLGVESALSPWHQGVVLDYNAGTLWWTQYKKEDQIDQSYITSYECIRDQTGLGAYTSMGIWDPLGPNSWFDAQASISNTSTYYIEVVLPSCFVSKANINTSRSNIKQQFANSEASVNEMNKNLILKISPNPIQEQLNISIDPKFIGADFSINDASGKSIFNGSVLASDMTVDMNQYAKGTYYFTAEKSGQVLTKMFVKN